jgi:hypothetical protein
MSYGIRKGLEDIAHELKGIRAILNSFWAEQYKDGKHEYTNPQAYADEYISTEECGRRLGVRDQTIRNWIAAGKKSPDKGWQEGIHYVNIQPGQKERPTIRIAWNQLVRSFAKNKEIEVKDFRDAKGNPAYTKSTPTLEDLYE